MSEWTPTWKLNPRSFCFAYYLLLSLPFHESFSAINSRQNLKMSDQKMENETEAYVLVRFCYKTPKLLILILPSPLSLRGILFIKMYKIWWVQSHSKQAPFCLFFNCFLLPFHGSFSVFRHPSKAKPKTVGRVVRFCHKTSESLMLILQFPQEGKKKINFFLFTAHFFVSKMWKIGGSNHIQSGPGSDYLIQENAEPVWYIWQRKNDEIGKS